MALKFNWLREIWKVNDDNQCKCSELYVVMKTNTDFPCSKREGCEHRGTCTCHLHRKTRNYSRKIKWFVPFHLERFRKHGLWFKVMQCSLFSWFGYTHVQLYFVAVVLPPCQICLLFYMYKISTHQVICVNGKHPGYTLNLLMWPAVSMLLICFKNMKVSSNYFFTITEQFLTRWFRLRAIVDKSTDHENDMMALAKLFSFLLLMHFIFQETSMETLNILTSLQKQLLICLSHLSLLWLLYQTLHRIFGHDSRKRSNKKLNIHESLSWSSFVGAASTAAFEWQLSKVGSAPWARSKEHTSTLVAEKRQN